MGTGLGTGLGTAELLRSSVRRRSGSSLFSSASPTEAEKYGEVSSSRRPPREKFLIYKSRPFPSTPRHPFLLFFPPHSLSPSLKSAILQQANGLRSIHCYSFVHSSNPQFLILNSAPVASARPHSIKPTQPSFPASPGFSHPHFLNHQPPQNHHSTTSRRHVLRYSSSPPGCCARRAHSSHQVPGSSHHPWYVTPTPAANLPGQQPNNNPTSPRTLLT